MDFWENSDAFSNETCLTITKYLNPENRASTIFPVYKTVNVGTHINFLAYWLLKHKVSVAVVITLRDAEGKILSKEWFPIAKLKTYRLRIDTFFRAIGFCGSVEVEVYSKHKPLFTFPAVVLEYSGVSDVSFVHSCIRTYNINEKVDEYALNAPQTGFDVIITRDVKTCIFFMGGEKHCYSIELELQSDAQVERHFIKIQNNFRGQLHCVDVGEVFPDFIGHSIDKVVINHDLDVFPRFYICIIQKDHTPTLTHTFFDTSDLNDKMHNLPVERIRSANVDTNKYFDSAFMVPYLGLKKINGFIKSYSQNLRYDGEILARVYSSCGKLIKQRKLNDDEFKIFNGSGTFELQKLFDGLGELCKETAHIFFGFRSETYNVPIRLKLALNYCRQSELLGTNICFSPTVQSLGTLRKPFTRRWAPLGGAQQIAAFFHLTSLSITSSYCPIKYSFEIINSKGIIYSGCGEASENATVMFDPVNDEKLKQLTFKETCWIYLTAENYIIDGYYLSQNRGTIGGDHAF